MADLQLFKKNKRAKATLTTTKSGQNYLQITLDYNNKNWSLTKRLLRHINESCSTKKVNCSITDNKIVLLMILKVSLIRPVYQKNLSEMLIRNTILPKPNENDHERIVRTYQFRDQASKDDKLLAMGEFMRNVFIGQRKPNFFNNREILYPYETKPIAIRGLSICERILQKLIQRLKQREALRKQLDDVYVHTWSGDNLIQLDYDSVMEISDYLENEDLENFVKAFGGWE